MSHPALRYVEFSPTRVGLRAKMAQCEVSDLKRKFQLKSHNLRALEPPASSLQWE